MMPRMSRSGQASSGAEQGWPSELWRHIARVCVPWSFAVGFDQGQGASALLVDQWKALEPSHAIRPDS